MTKEQYRRYLGSAHWKRLRARIVARAQDHCEWCGRFCGAPEHDREEICTGSERCDWCQMYYSPDGWRNDVEMQRLEVHHRTYERLGAERDTDLVALCWCCHDEITDRHAMLRMLADAGVISRRETQPVHGEQGYAARALVPLALHLMKVLP